MSGGVRHAPILSTRSEKCHVPKVMWVQPTMKIQDLNLPKSVWFFTETQFLGVRIVRPLKLPSAAEMFEYWNSGAALE